MYFGSVKFFKHLIYSLAVILIAIPVIFAIIFGLKYYGLKKNPTTPPQISTENDNLVEKTDLSQIITALKNPNFSNSEFIEALKINDTALLNEIFQSRFVDTTTELEYIKKYPDLYATPPTEFSVAESTVYLTFDDGPSENTVSILDILDKYNIKATFFISGDEKERSKEILKQVAERGHSIGIHSYSHNYNTIYKDVDAFLEDFNNTYNFIYDATGVKPDIFRFAGGSINNYNSLIYKQIIAETTRRGYVYYDWNASGEDASEKATWTSIYNSVLKSLNGRSRSIILLHDGADKYKTVTVVEDLIIALQKQGYNFDKITHDVKPITFGYID